MKKIILTLVFAFTIGTMINANITIDSKEKNLTIISEPVDCWAQADAAEAAFCGSVGCNTDYWLGKMDSCMGF